MCKKALPKLSLSLLVAMLFLFIGWGGLRPSQAALDMQRLSHPNFAPLSAQDPVMLVADQAITGEIESPHERDIYLFQGTAGDEVTVFVDDQTDGRLKLTILNPDGSEFGFAEGESTSAGGDVQIGRQALTATGVFTIIVDGVGNTNGLYRLAYANLSADTTPITADEAIYEQLDYPGDEDAYTFTGKTGDLVTVFVDDQTDGGAKRAMVTMVNPDIS